MNYFQCDKSQTVTELDSTLCACGCSSRAPNVRHAGPRAGAAEGPGRGLVYRTWSFG